MKAQSFKILSMAVAVAAAIAGGTALAQTTSSQAHTTFGSSGNAAGTTPAPGTTAIPGTTSTSGTVTINTSTGVVTNANGTVTTLQPGQTIIVLPSAGTSVGAANSITGVIVPANSAAVRSILAAFAGSSANLTALEQGLINRTPITLTSGSGSASFTSPVVAMTQADATQALLLATSQLASLGVSQPTPQQIQAALLGGTVTGSTGQSVALSGVLDLRRQGLNFVQIAQALNAQAAFGFQGSTIATPGATTPAATGSRDAARPAAAGNPAIVRRDGGISSNSSSSTTTSSSAATTAPATGAASSAPPAGSASATRGNPSATGGAGLR